MMKNVRNIVYNLLHLMTRVNLLGSNADILEAADAIERFIAGLSKAEFINIVLYLTVDRCYLPSDKAT